MVLLIAGLLDRQRDLSVLDSLHQTGSTASIPTHFSERVEVMVSIRRADRRHIPMGSCVWHPGLVPHSPHRCLLASGEAGVSICVRNFLRKRFCNHIRNPRGGKHGARCGCARRGRATLLQHKLGEEIILGPPGPFLPRCNVREKSTARGTVF